MISGEDIRRLLGGAITIHPYNPSELQGSSYNFTVGELAWIHPAVPASAPRPDTLPLSPKSRLGRSEFDVPPGKTVSVLTREILHIDQSVGGLVHSKVGVITQGFSHVSTTVDPGWIGPLLITMTNLSDRVLSLRQGDGFVTLTFYRLSAPTEFRRSNPTARTDLLQHMRFLAADSAGNEWDYFNKGIYSDVEALHSAFAQSPEGQKVNQAQEAERHASRRRATAGRIRYKRYGLVLLTLVMLGLMVSPFWGPALGLPPVDPWLLLVAIPGVIAFLNFVRGSWGVDEDT